MYVERLSRSAAYLCKVLCHTSNWDDKGFGYFLHSKKGGAENEGILPVF